MFFTFIKNIDKYELIYTLFTLNEYGFDYAFAPNKTSFLVVVCCCGGGGGTFDNKKLKKSIKSFGISISGERKYISL